MVEWYNRYKENKMAKKLVERNAEIKRLRVEEGKTLQEIADIFGVTRERIRQLIPNTGSRFITRWTESKINDFDLSTCNNIYNLPGSHTVWRKLWGKFRHKAKGGHIEKGQLYEEKASEMLNSMGISNKLMPTHHPFDILLDTGVRIDVKRSDFDVSSLQTQNCVSPTYPIANMKCGEDCDFFFVFVPDAIFIIPASEVSTDRIRICYPQMGRKPSKWNQYKDRFDLLSNQSLM